MLSSLEFSIVSSKYKDYYSSEKDLRKTNYKTGRKERREENQSKPTEFNLCHFLTMD